MTTSDSVDVSVVVSLSDDAILISEEWLRSVGFDNCKPCHVWGTPNRNWWNERLELEIWQFSETDQWLWVEFDSVSMRTRRDLRLLMEWIGLRLK